MNTAELSQQTSFSSLRIAVEALRVDWSVKAADGSLAAAEIFGPDYRRTAAEKFVADPQEMTRKKEELHIHRQRICKAIDNGFNSADKILDDTEKYLKDRGAPTGMQEFLIEGLESELKSFIESMQKFETSLRRSEAERPALLKESEYLIRRFSESDIERATNLELLQEREATIRYLYSPEFIDASVRNNSEMKAKMLSVLELVEAYSSRYKVPV
jgi:hypothetical protein